MINSQESLSSAPKKSPFFTSEKRPPLRVGIYPIGSQGVRAIHNAATIFPQKYLAR